MAATLRRADVRPRSRRAAGPRVRDAALWAMTALLVLAVLGLWAWLALVPR